MKLFFSVVLITGYSTTPPPVSSVMSPGWQLSALQPTNQAASKVSLMIPENSMAKGWYCISQAIFAISSKTLFPLNFKFFCFFFFSFLGGPWMFWCSERGREYHFNQGLPVLNQLHCAPNFSPVVLAVSSPTSLRQIQGNDCGSQGTRDTDFPTGASQAYDFNLVRVKFGRPGRGGWCRVNQMGTTEGAWTLAFSNQEAPPAI